MVYDNSSIEQFIKNIEKLETFNKQFLAEKDPEDKGSDPWTGNLGYWYYNLKTNSVTFNPLKFLALGYSAQEIPKEVNYQFFTDKIHPEDFQRTLDAMHSHLNGEVSVYEVEYRIQGRNGSWKWF